MRVADEAPERPVIGSDGVERGYHSRSVVRVCGRLPFPTRGIIPPGLAVGGATDTGVHECVCGAKRFGQASHPGFHRVSGAATAVEGEDFAGRCDGTVGDVTLSRRCRCESRRFRSRKRRLVPVLFRSHCRRARSGRANRILIWFSRRHIWSQMLRLAVQTSSASRLHLRTRPTIR